MTNTCNRCSQQLTTENWSANNQRTRTYKCTPCYNAYAKEKRLAKDAAAGKCPVTRGPYSKRPLGMSVQEYRRSYGLRYRKKNAEKLMLSGALKRATQKNLPFDLSIDDIVIPEACPVLGIPLEIGAGRSDNSPSLDRKIPEKGYVKGNIAVISYRANRLKSDASLEELRNLVSWLEK